MPGLGGSPRSALWWLPPSPCCSHHVQPFSLGFTAQDQHCGMGTAPLATLGGHRASPCSVFLPHLPPSAAPASAPLRAHPPTRHRPVMMPGGASLPCQAINPADLHARRPHKSKASAKGGELEQRGGARSSPARGAGRGPGQAGDVCCTARVWSCWGIICGHCWHPESPLVQILVP